MLTVRAMNIPEVLQYRALCALCFNAPLTQPPPRCPDLTASFAAFDGDELLAGMLAHRFQIHFQGEVVGMAGIGGVASWPEKRRAGAVRAVFEAMLPELYARGDVFSALYPFSHAFYRKFGYELCMQLTHARVTPQALGSGAAETTGSFELHLPSDDHAVIYGLRERYAQRFDFTLKREPERFDDLLGKDPYADLQPVYLWRDDAGEPQGYIVFKRECEAGQNFATVLDAAYLTPEALRSILRFLGRFNSYDHYRITLPPDVELRAFIGEAYQATCERNCAGMARVINVEKALRVTRAPSCDGTITLRVRDGQIPQNNGTFAVAYADGAASVSRCDDEPDLTLSIQALTQLVTGAMEYDAFRMCASDVVFHKDNPLLPLCFPKRMLFMNDGF